MADLPITKLDPQDTEDPPLDVSLSSPSASPRHESSEPDFVMGGIRPEMQVAAYDSKYGLSQVTDASGKFEEVSKMYICHLCDFRTAFRNSLLNHQAVHSDFRPWVCTVCEYAAKRKQDLKKHLHTIHGLMVESTMLKPVGLPGTNSSTVPGSLTRGESVEDNSWDGTKVNKMTSLDPVAPSSHFLQGVLDMPQNTAGSRLPGSSEILSISIKQEKLESGGQKPLPGMSNFVHQSPPESDYDLPVSFPSVSTYKNDTAGQLQNTAKSSEAYFHSERIYTSMLDKNKSTRDCRQTQPHSKNLSDGDFPSYSFSTHTRKRPRGYADNPAHSEISQDQSTPPLVKSSKISDLDDHLPCSSSVGVCLTRGSQTQTCFVCEFCDIMFFQRAMYLMHAGLHSPDNPWCCAVCGSSFTEKYSFTSHFINQH